MKESQNIEWKENWRDEYLKWICGFANAQGGKIYIGKDDSGNVTGISNAEKLLKDLPNKIRDGLGLMPEVNLHEVNGKSYIDIIVEPSTVPISLRGSYYLRSGSTKQELKGNALTEFLLKKMGMTWDRVIESKATFDDIDESAIEAFKIDASKAGRMPDIQELGSEEILRKLRLITREGITRAALVLFGKDPGEFYPNLFVKLGRFGLTDVDMRFQEVSEGNLIFMLKDVVEILEHKFLIKNISFEGIQRIETLEFPKAALREMLLNALVHRNYLGSMTQLKVYDDRLTLWNAGTLPEELTVEDLFKSHESIPRNPLIAEICYKAGYIDSWGRGIEKISSACAESRLPEPIISERSGGVIVELKKTTGKTTGNITGKTTGNGTEPSLGVKLEGLGNKLGNKLGNNRVKILQAMKENPQVSTRQLSEMIGISQTAIENNLKYLKENGYIERVGGTRGYWQVKGEKN